MSETKRFQKLLYHEERQEDGRLAVVIDGCDPEVRVLRVPEEIHGLPVVEISDYSMQENEELQEVWLPKCLERLGECAFPGLTPLRVHLFHHIRDRIPLLCLKEEQFDFQEELTQDSSALDYEEERLEFRYFIDRGDAGIVKPLDNFVSPEIPDKVAAAGGVPIVGISYRCFLGAHFCGSAVDCGKVFIPHTVRYIGIAAFWWAKIHCRPDEVGSAAFVLPSGIQQIEEDAFGDTEVWPDWDYTAGRKYDAAWLEIHPGQEKLEGFPWGATKVRYVDGTVIELPKE